MRPEDVLERKTSFKKLITKHINFVWKDPDREKIPMLKRFVLTVEDSGCMFVSEESIFHEEAQCWADAPDGEWDWERVQNIFGKELEQMGAFPKKLNFGFEPVMENKNSQLSTPTYMDILEEKTSFKTIIVKDTLYSKKYSQEPCRKREELTVEDNGYMFISGDFDFEEKSGLWRDSEDGPWSWECVEQVFGEDLKRMGLFPEKPNFISTREKAEPESREV